MVEIDLESRALEIAKEHLLNKTPLKTLGKTYHVAPSTIHRRLIKWLAEGRFDILDKTENTSTAHVVEMDNDLGERLARKTKVWRARVARVSGVEHAFNHDYLKVGDSPEARAAFKAGDELHRCLGDVAANSILSSLRRDMVIGLASGRGVGFAITKMGELAQKTPSWASGFESVRLVSLCGGARVGTWEITTHRDFDADENAFAMAAILKVPRNNVFYMSAPISVEPGEHRPESEFKYSLDLAVIGLGQLNTHHHYFRHRDEVQSRAIAEPIRQIMEWQSRRPDLLDSLAEIVHRLYPVGGKELPAEFLNALAEINKAVVAIPAPILKRAREVILIAGGMQKFSALFEIINNKAGDIPIDTSNLTLITDSGTAEMILKRLG